MAETVHEATAAVGETPAISRLCLCEQYVRVTEGAALTAARWLGRATTRGYAGQQDQKKPEPAPRSIFATERADPGFLKYLENIRAQTA